MTGAPGKAANLSLISSDGPIDRFQSNFQLSEVIGTHECPALPLWQLSDNTYLEAILTPTPTQNNCSAKCQESHCLVNIYLFEILLLKTCRLRLSRDSVAGNFLQNEFHLTYSRRQNVKSVTGNKSFDYCSGRSLDSFFCPCTCCFEEFVLHICYTSLY